MTITVEVRPGVTTVLSAARLEGEEVWVVASAPEDLEDQDGVVWTEMGEGGRIWGYLCQVEEIPDYEGLQELIDEWGGSR